jgi:DNA-binding NtrC family response regulator
MEKFMSTANILIVDDKKDVRDSLSEKLHQEGYEITTAEDGHDALEQLRKKRFNVVLTKAQMPGMDGLELLNRIKSSGIDTKVILTTENGTIPKAIEAVKFGAFHYLDKFDVSDDSKLKRVLEAALESHPPGLMIDDCRLMIEKISPINNRQSTINNPKNQPSEKGLHHLIGNSRQMQEIYSLITRVAASNATVLIGGETGTGKNLVAKAIYHQSLRCRRPFIKVDCAGIPEELLESDLFGHLRGAFTTAVRDKKGKFELADKGTLLLDDIDCLPMKLQAKLLRVLQDREFEKLGGISTQEVDIRIIAASNQDLQEAVANKTFRADLFYRLNVIHIYLPPLRDRLDDLEALAENFLSVYNRKNGMNISGISPQAIKMMKNYSWLGNVRELENAIERAVVLKQRGYIEPEDLKLLSQQNASVLLEKLTVDHHIPLRDYLKNAEEQKILATLKQYNWKRKDTAEALGISRITLYSKMKEYGLER